MGGRSERGEEWERGGEGGQRVVGVRRKRIRKCCIYIFLTEESEKFT